MKTNLKTKILSGLGFGLLITIIVQILSFYYTNQLYKANRWVVHTYEVQTTNEKIFSDLFAMENKVRGYVITKNQNFLQDLEVIHHELNQNLVRLKNLIQDNSRQISRVIELGNLIDQKIKIFGEAILASKENNNQQVVLKISSGKKVSDEIRRVYFEINKEETELLKIRENEGLQISEKVTLIIIISGFLAILIVGVSIFYIFKDINNQKFLEEQLKENEYRIKQFLEALPIGVFVIDKNGKAFYANKQSQLLLGKGIAPEAPLSKYSEIYKVFVADTDKEYPTHELPIVQALQGKESHVDDMEIRRPDKNILIEVNACPVFDSEGTVSFAIASFTDITRRKQAEKDLLEAKRQAEENMRAKESFLANMSHEIRTPLNAILGFASLLTKTKLDSEQQQFSETISSSAEALLIIINDILDLSKIEAGMMQFENIPFSFDGLLHSIQMMLSSRAKDKNLQLNLENSVEPDMVKGDPTRLTQILVNLIGNALKFTEKGSVTIKAETEKKYEGSVKVRISIIDTGIGIPSEKIETIFERFNQAEADTTRKYGGTGLGLSIVQNLVKMQGGEIEVKSKEGIGSEFIVNLHFSLPDKKEQEDYLRKNTDKVNYKEDNKLSGLKALLVEDNPINQKLALKVLRDEYHMIAEYAENGKEGFEKARTGDYDIILMDLQMPEMDGYESVNKIRNELKSTVPIIAMTAHAMSGEREKCLASGFDDYVSKPFKADHLYSRMVELVGNVNLRKSESGGIDLSYLKQLSSDPEFIKEMIETFIQYMPKYIENLNNALIRNEISEVRASAHKMNSSLATMGMQESARISMKIEEIAYKGEGLNQLEELCKILTKNVNNALDELTRISDNLK